MEVGCSPHEAGEGGEGNFNFLVHSLTMNQIGRELWSIETILLCSSEIVRRIVLNLNPKPHLIISGELIETLRTVHVQTAQSVK